MPPTIAAIVQQWRRAFRRLFTVLDGAAAGWHGVTYTAADVQLLHLIRRDLGLARAGRSAEPDPHSDVADVA